MPLIENTPTVQQPPGGSTTSMRRPVLRLAYLTSAYPEVSHTFIRREIQELERRGHQVRRLSIRPSSSTLVDPIDQSESASTHVVLDQPVGTLLWQSVATMVSRPRRFFDALRMTWRMASRSDRGLIPHLAYLVEACHLRRLLAAEEIKHIHVHFGSNPAAVAMLMQRLGGPSYSMTVHGPDEFDNARGYSLGDKIAGSSLTVAISSYGRAQLRRWVSPEHWPKIQIVHCTIDDQYDGDPEPIDPASRTLVCIGRLAEQKGQLTLIEAMATVAGRGVESHLVLVGDGPMRGEIERRIAELDLGDRVTITGWARGDEVRHRLRQCRAMVLPSYAEGLPVVIMEAMAMARPVIATQIAAIPELVEPGRSGWLVAASDADALAVAIEDAMKAPVEQLNRMGHHGRRRVLAEHHPETEVDRIESLLREHVPAIAQVSHEIH